MLVIVFRINICSNCNIGLQPTKSFFFFNPNSDLNYHFKMSFDPWVGKISSKREWLPTQCPCLENSMDRGAWQATVHGALKESDTTEQLPLSLHFLFTLRCLLHQEVFRRIAFFLAVLADRPSPKGVAACTVWGRHAASDPRPPPLRFCCPLQLKILSVFLNELIFQSLH